MLQSCDILPKLTAEDLKDLGVVYEAVFRENNIDRDNCSRPTLRSQPTMSMTATQTQGCRTSSSCQEKVSRTGLHLLFA